MAGYFELSNAEGGQFKFNLKVTKNATTDERYLRKTAKDGSPYFVLTATNGEIIGKSEMYSSASAMENGIASVNANAPTAATKDLTT